MAVIKKNKKKQQQNNTGCSGYKNVIGEIGDNCVVKDCPVLIPKQNMDSFNMFKQGSDNTKTFGDWPSPFDIWNKK